MERAGVTPDEEIDLDELTPEEEEKLAPYKDFIEGWTWRIWENRSSNPRAKQIRWPDRLGGEAIVGFRGCRQGSC